MDDFNPTLQERLDSPTLPVPKAEVRKLLDAMRAAIDSIESAQYHDMTAQARSATAHAKAALRDALKEVGCSTRS